MNLQHVFDSPDQYLFQFDGGNAVFVEMDREAYSRSIFFDRRISPKSNTATAVSRADLHKAARTREPSPVCYIFHIAHCGSTLLARALDLKDSNLVIREPRALRQLGAAAGGQLFGRPVFGEWSNDLHAASVLLGRRYKKDAPVFVKANVPVNFMITPVMNQHPRQPALLLHYSLENYLLAILRSESHLWWVMHITQELQLGIDTLVGPAPEGASNAVNAGRLWLAQMILYRDALAAFPNAASLDAEWLFNTPSPTLAAAFSHFGQTQSADVIDAIVGSELFSRYSKDPKVRFDNASRLERQEQLRLQLAPELNAARAWIEPRAAKAGLPAQLDRPLVGQGAALL